MKSFKRHLQATISLLLVLSLVPLGLTVPTFADTVISAEEKITSTATLDMDFNENRIIVVLNKEASSNFKNYTVNDFPEINGKSVDELTPYSKASAKASVEMAKSTKSNSQTILSTAIGNYRQMICIELQNSGKKNVQNYHVKLFLDYH